MSVDEDGTEAAAATEVALATFGVEAGKPVARSRCASTAPFSLPSGTSPPARAFFWGDSAIPDNEEMPRW
jgi:hypothetical protein